MIFVFLCLKHGFLFIFAFIYIYLFFHTISIFIYYYCYYIMIIMIAILLKQYNFHLKKVYTKVKFIIHVYIPLNPIYFPPKEVYVKKSISKNVVSLFCFHRNPLKWVNII